MKSFGRSLQTASSDIPAYSRSATVTFNTFRNEALKFLFDNLQKAEDAKNSFESDLAAIDNSENVNHECVEDNRKDLNERYISFVDSINTCTTNIILEAHSFGETYLSYKPDYMDYVIRSPLIMLRDLSKNNYVREGSDYVAQAWSNSFAHSEFIDFKSTSMTQFGKLQSRVLGQLFSGVSGEDVLPVMGLVPCYSQNVNHFNDTVESLRQNVQDTCLN